MIDGRIHNEWMDELSSDRVSCNYGRQGGGGDEDGFGYLDRQNERGFWQRALRLSICPRSLPLS